MASSKILIIKHGSLGDIFMSLDSINSIRSHFGENIFFCTTNSGKKVLSDLDFNFKYIIDSRSKNPFNIINTIYKIIKEDFDYIIDLQNSQRTCLYITIFKLFNKSIISSTCPSANFRYIPPAHGTQHVSLGLKKQIELINIRIIKFSVKINHKINNIKSLQVLIVPGSSTKGKYKRWPIEYYNELIKEFLKMDFDCFIIGGNDDLDLSHKIIKHDRIHNLIGLSPWKKVIELASNANIAICNDTSNMHLISSLGCPTIAIIKEGPLAVANAPNNNNSFCFINTDISQVKSDDVFKKAQKIAR